MRSSESWRAVSKRILGRTAGRWMDSDALCGEACHHARVGLGCDLLGPGVASPHLWRLVTGGTFDFGAGHLAHQIYVFKIKSTEFIMLIDPFPLMIQYSNMILMLISI